MSGYVGPTPQPSPLDVLPGAPSGSGNALQDYVDQLSALHGFTDAHAAAAGQPPPWSGAALWPYANNPIGTETTQTMGNPSAANDPVAYMGASGPVMQSDLDRAHAQVALAKELAPTMVLGMAGDAPGGPAVATRSPDFLQGLRDTASALWGDTRGGGPNPLGGADSPNVSALRSATDPTALTPAEHDAIKTYGSASSWVNGDAPEAEAVRGHLDNAIAKSPLQSPTTLWRGFGATPDLVNNLKVGDVVPLSSGHVSTSLSKDVAQDFANDTYGPDETSVLVRINAPAGTGAVRVPTPPELQRYPGEEVEHQEMLLARGPQYRITDIHEPSDGRLNVTVEPVAPPATSESPAVSAMRAATAAPQAPTALDHLQAQQPSEPVPAARVTSAVPSEPGYVYHATNSERLQDIADSGTLNTHRPGDFTDQDAWPDGSTQKRNYFTRSAENTWQFAPEEGQPALLRMPADAHPIQAERGTGDLYSTKAVPAKNLEYLGNDGGWHPVASRASDRAPPVSAPAAPAPEVSRAPTAPPAASYPGAQPESRISTRVPSDAASAKAKLDPHSTASLEVDYNTAKQAPQALQKNADVVRQYPGIDYSRANTPQQVNERFINHVKGNLLDLWDRMGSNPAQGGMMPPGLRDRAARWYEGANVIANRTAQQTGQPLRNVAGSLASLSPQKDWFQNVDLNRRVVDTVMNHQNTLWTPEMSGWRDRYLPYIEADMQKRGMSPDKIVANMADLRDTFRSLQGRRFRDINDPRTQAIWLRAHDEAHRGRAYPTVTPEGEFGPAAMTQKGQPQNVTWGSFKEIGKALQSLQANDLPTISRQMGGNHKVRNFYNNIIDPSDPRAVTIDTHAIAAGLMRPLGASSPEVNAGLGTGGASDNATLGLKGLYPLYAEAYRRAAAARGVLPRQMQSVTWEGVRGLFSPEQKRNVKFVGENTALWRANKRGRTDATRQSVVEHARGIDPPEWFGSGP